MKPLANAVRAASRHTLARLALGGVLGGLFQHCDANTSSGGCSAGAVITITKTVMGSPGSTIMQTLSSATLGNASASFAQP